MNTPEKQTVDEWLLDYSNAVGTFYFDGKIIKYRDVNKLIDFCKSKRKEK